MCANKLLQEYHLIFFKFNFMLQIKQNINSIRKLCIFFSQITESVFVRDRIKNIFALN